MEYSVKTKYIKEEIAELPELKEFKFETWPDEIDGNTWLFKRDENHYFEFYDKFTYLNARLIQEDPLRRVIDLKDMVASESLSLNKRSAMGYSYATETEFKNIVLTLKNIILKYGLFKLDEMIQSCRNFDLVHNKNYFLYIEQNRNSLSEDFEILSPQTLPEKGLIRLSLKIENFEGWIFSDAIRLLLDFSIIYGNWLIKYFGGEWCWKGNIYGIQNVGKKRCFVIPIDEIFKKWNGYDFKSYKELKKEYGG